MKNIIFNAKIPKPNVSGKSAIPKENMLSIVYSIFFHPDFTVGPGIKPDHAIRLAGYTADRDLHHI